MNRTIAILAAIVVVIAVWYFGFRSQPEVVPEATTTTETAPATTTETTTAPAATTETTTAPATTTETTTAPATTTETTTAPATTTETTTAPATTTETTAAPAGDIAALLDPATFDADKLIAAVDTSTLDDATKTTLKTAIEGARNNPGAVQAVIDQVKAAMGM
ncbi:hypothetical protein [Albidovulum sp.]|jgi:cytoskeletal protein RodZ|uniref:hypothetical protein n=1 Tax=Albidovulum sp. TaxID=1872424 RepID=UPI0030722A18